MNETTRRLRFWRWLLHSPEIKRVVRIKSLLPRWDSYMGGVAWPVLLVDRVGGGRETITPIWDMARLRGLWRSANAE